MDRIVALLVRVVSLFAGWAQVLPGAQYARYVPGQKLKVLLAGYNGARNTGSDVRVAALADQIIAALGADNVEVSVMSFDLESTAPYFEGKVRQVSFSTIFFIPLLKACSEHHVVVLCEGSTFKSKFADALTLYSCEAAGVARAQGKPCIAYGGEIGQMEPYLERTVRDLCSDVFFMARSEASYKDARNLGLQAWQGTDTAWTFDSSRGHDTAMRLLREGGWDGRRPLLTIAPINPFWWPVRSSLAKWAASKLGSKRFIQFQKWYFFSWSAERAEAYNRYLDNMCAAARTFARERGFQLVVVGMEKLDEDACLQASARLGGDIPVVLAKNYDGYVMGEILRSSSLLLTSRYHAQVLATGASVPAVAVSMDERLDNLAAELGTPRDLLLHVGQEDLAERILIALDCAQDNRDAIEQCLDGAHARLEGVLSDIAGEFASYLSARAVRSASGRVPYAWALGRLALPSRYSNVSFMLPVR